MATPATAARPRRVLSRFGVLAAGGKLRAGAGFILGALAFAGANLLLAGHLAPAAFGTLALIVAVIALAAPLGPLGLGVMVASRRLEMAPQVPRRCLKTSLLVALCAAALAGLVYDLPRAALAVIAGSVAAGGMLRLAAAVLQREERHLGATFVFESTNWFLLAGALATVLAGSANLLLPLMAVLLGQAVLLAFIWRPLLAARAEVPGQRIRSSDLLLLTGSSVGLLLLLQVERLAIPIFLDTRALAAFAVLAVFAIAPFRPVEVSTWRTLVVRLGRPAGPRRRRRLLARECLQTGVAAVVLGALIAVLAPTILAHLFDGKYDVGTGAVFAAIVSGMLRVARSVVGAVITALGDRRTLAWWNGASLVSVLAVVLGGWAGSPWGLTGFLWGVVAGAALNIVLTVPLALRNLRAPRAAA